MDDFSDDYDATKASGEGDTPPVEIPLEALSEQALAGVVENYILREGTDYGTQEVGYESKVDRVKKQLERGEIKIIFDPNSETVTLMTAREWERASNA